MKRYLYLLFATVLAACTTTTPSGQETPTSPADTAEASTVTPILSSDQLMFKASGNEPFWGLKVDANKNLYFSSIDDHNLQLISATKYIRRVNDGNGFDIQGEVPGGYLKVMVLPERCGDSMSDKQYGYQVQVAVKADATAKDLLYRGCGNFEDYFAINDTWHLVKIDGLPTDRVKGDPPYLQFSVLDGKMYGNTGCNSVNSSLTLKASKLKLGPVMSTKRGCPKDAAEHHILPVLNSESILFKMNGEQLVLKGQNGGTLVFNRKR